MPGDAAAALVEAWRGRALAAERQLELSQARESELAAQIRMVLEERFYRPVVSGAAQEPRRSAGGDAAVFPPGTDLGEDAGEVLWAALRDLKEEHEQSHAEKA